MKVITKIVEYLPDTQQIVIKICRLHSHKTIDEHRTFAIEIYDLDTVSYTHLTLPTKRIV